MGLWDDIRDGMAARRAGLTVDEYREFRAYSGEEGLTLEVYRRYRARYAGSMSLRRYIDSVLRAGAPAPRPAAQQSPAAPVQSAQAIEPAAQAAEPARRRRRAVQQAEAEHRAEAQTTEKSAQAQTHGGAEEPAAPSARRRRRRQQPDEAALQACASIAGLEESAEPAVEPVEPIIELEESDEPAVEPVDPITEPEESAELAVEPVEEALAPEESDDPAAELVERVAELEERGELDDWLADDDEGIWGQTIEDELGITLSVEDRKKGISWLKMSHKLYKTLRDANVYEIGELAELRWREIERLPGLKSIDCDEIVGALRQFAANMALMKGLDGYAKRYATPVRKQTQDAAKKTDVGQISQTLLAEEQKNSLPSEDKTSLMAEAENTETRAASVCAAQTEDEPAEQQSEQPEAKEEEIQQVGPELAESEQAEPEHAEPEQAETEQAEPEEAEPEQADPEEAEPEQAETEEVEPEQADPEEAEPEEAVIEEAEPEQAEIELPETEETEAERTASGRSFRHLLWDAKVQPEGETPIEVLGLSVRSSNALHRAGVHTIGALLGYSEEKLMALPNLGRKSCQEIIDKLCMLLTGADADTVYGQQAVVQVPARDMTLREQLFPDWEADEETLNESIDNLGLSVRSSNALHRADVANVDQLLSLKEGELRAVRNLGRGSYDEIIDKLKRFRRLAPAMGTKRKETWWNRPLNRIEGFGGVADILRERGIESFDTLFIMSDQQIRDLKQIGKEKASKILYGRGEYIRSRTERNRERSEAEDCGEREQIVLAFENAWLESGKHYDLRCAAEAIDKALEETAEGENHLLMERLYGQPFFRAKLKAILYAVAEAAFDPLSVSEMAARLLRGVPETLVEKLAEELVGDGILLPAQKGRYEAKRPSILEAAAQLPEGRNRQILELRLEGKTLQEISDEVGITRERVRQVSTKLIRKLTHRGLHHAPYAGRFREDRYAYLYRTYSVKRADFLDMSGEPVSTYAYLQCRYDGGRKPLEDALEDEDVPAEVREKLAERRDEGYILLGGERILRRRGELEDYFIRTHCREETEYDAFIEAYNAFIMEHLPDDGDKYLIQQSNEMSRINRLVDGKTVLWKQGQRFRYYNIPGTDLTELLETLNLGQYRDTEYSTLKFLRMYPDLMKRYDIRDEYELHNLLKKCGAFDHCPEIEFARMPAIRFGQSDRDEIVRRKMFEIAPVSLDELCQALEEETGFRADTIAANWLDCIDMYLHNRVYTCDSAVMPDKQVETMRQALTEPCYTYEEARSVYRQLFGEADDALLTPFNYRRMGFTTYSHCILKGYPSLEAYFSEFLLSEDVFDLNPIGQRFRYNPSFSAFLSKIKDDYEIIEYEPGQYMNIRRLRTIGIDKPALRAYCDAVYDFAGQETVFTVESIRQDGFEHELDGLGFDAWFYASILREDERLTYGKLGGTVAFTAGQETPSRTWVIRCIIDEAGSMDIDDLILLLADRYGITMDRTDVFISIADTPMYYDDIMEKVYDCYDTYFEEL